MTDPTKVTKTDVQLIFRPLHGRTDKDQNMDDWGTTGPDLIIEWYHCTYSATHTVGLVGTGDCCFLEITNDMIYYDGVYYGDWEVFLSTSELTHDPVPFDPEKAIPPETAQQKEIYHPPPREGGEF